MPNDDELFEDIPAFLRRAPEPWPDNPRFPVMPAPEAAGVGTAEPDEPRAEIIPFNSHRLGRGGIPARLNAEAAASDRDDDEMLHVALPRAVVRTLGVQAARSGTTVRAVILQAFGVAGLTDAEATDRPHPVELPG